MTSLPPHEDPQPGTSPSAPESPPTVRRTAFEQSWPLLLGAGLGGVATAAFGPAAGLAAMGVGALGHSFAQAVEQRRQNRLVGGILARLETGAFGLAERSAREDRDDAATEQAEDHQGRSRRHALAELERQLEISEAARRGQSALLAELAPEITGALRGIARIADGLGETDLTLEQRDCVESIAGSTETLTNLLGDVLDLARIEAGRLKLRRKDFHLASAVETVVEELYPLAWKKGLELIVEVDAGLGDWFFGDERRVMQLLRHLLRGSIQTTDRGEVRLVVVPSTPDAPDDGPLRFEIHDTAPVHTQAELARLLEGSPSTLESLAELDLSLGLGLARGLVEVMGGRLGAHAKGDGGNLFWIEMPLGSSQEPHASLASDFSALVGVRLLVVDARSSARTSLVGATERLGLIVGEASSSEHAVRQVADAIEDGEAFDTILIDDDLHGGQGRALAQELAVQHGDGRPAIVLLTSAGRAQNPARLAELGIDAWIPKPVRIQRLQEALLFVNRPGATNDVAPADDVDGQAVCGTREPSSRVILVQDEPMRARVISAQLASNGCRVDVIDEFEGLTSAFQDGVYDLVLIDCQPEPMQRHKILREVRAIGASSGPRLRIVSIHESNRSQEQHTLWMEAGADACLPCPLSPLRSRIALSVLLGEAGDPSPAPMEDEAMHQESDSVLDPDVVQSLKDLGGDDDPGLFAELVELFLRDMPPRLDSLSEAMDSGDAKQLERTAHAMKSSCGNLGAMALAELCRQIEVSGRTGDVDGVRSLVQASQSEYQRVCEALAQELGQG